MRDPKKKYKEYLDWFEETVKDQSKWEYMRSERQCSNWTDPDSKPERWEFGLWSLYTADVQVLTLCMRRNKRNNTLTISEAMKHVGGNPDAPLLNPHYLEAAEKLKEMRKKLKDYSGSSDYASDELFRMKQEADSKGIEFAQAAKERLEEFRGKEIKPEPDLEILKEDQGKLRVSVFTKIFGGFGRRGKKVKFKDRDLSKDGTRFFKGHIE